MLSSNDAEASSNNECDNFWMFCSCVSWSVLLTVFCACSLKWFHGIFKIARYVFVKDVADSITDIIKYEKLQLYYINSYSFELLLSPKWTAEKTLHSEFQHSLNFSLRANFGPPFPIYLEIELNCLTIQYIAIAFF